jgi:hypothetical protein
MTRTMTTSKGETITSTLSDQQAARIVAATSGSGFARSLVEAHARGRLSERQRPWLHKLATETVARREGAAPAAAPAPAAAVNLTGINALFATASQHLRHPKITLDQDGRRLRLSIAGARSRYAGSLMVTDGRPFGENTWYGHITQDGAFHASRSSEQWVVDALTALGDDPASFARLYGRKTGNCCFCARELSTAESLTAGYGPICADHYGLPWGEVDAQEFPSRAVAA